MGGEEEPFGRITLPDLIESLLRCRSYPGWAGSLDSIPCHSAGIEESLRGLRRRQIPRFPRNDGELGSDPPSERVYSPTLFACGPSAERSHPSRPASQSVRHLDYTGADTWSGQAPGCAQMAPLPLP
jgi:hypothetical protein